MPPVASGRIRTWCDRGRVGMTRAHSPMRGTRTSLPDRVASAQYWAEVIPSLRLILYSSSDPAPTEFKAVASFGKEFARSSESLIAPARQPSRSIAIPLRRNPISGAPRPEACGLDSATETPLEIAIEASDGRRVCPN